ncbi:heme exporter protein CcmD [Paroceanicella profunda]|uniref:Heme exporter protein D n=1 Tax=Paroceanicella profunda TaxID=2579971 RepID=A0A5B8FZM2_9RHOB|nr:heme exporter protein CcmD [Paroceanicella profunda]QDL92840.1 heme exporter protein CcmD [Paroceanicella profunda]
MLPDLGRYTVAVLGAYGVTLAALALLVGASWLRHRRVKAALARLEALRRPPDE